MDSMIQPDSIALPLNWINFFFGGGGTAVPRCTFFSASVIKNASIISDLLHLRNSPILRSSQPARRAQLCRIIFFFFGRLIKLNLNQPAHLKNREPFVGPVPQTPAPAFKTLRKHLRNSRNGGSIRLSKFASEKNSQRKAFYGSCWCRECSSTRSARSP